MFFFDISEAVKIGNFSQNEVALLPCLLMGKEGGGIRSSPQALRGSLLGRCRRSPGQIYLSHGRGRNGFVEVPGIFESHDSGDLFLIGRQGEKLVVRPPRRIIRSLSQRQRLFSPSPCHNPPQGKKWFPPGSPGRLARACA